MTGKVQNQCLNPQFWVRFRSFPSFLLQKYKQVSFELKPFQKSKTTPHHPLGMRLEKGFTLIEVMIVVFIIALISAVILPSISNYFKVSIESSAREMSSVIREAYQSSVVTGKVYRVVYDFEKKEYWVEAGPPTLLLATEDSQKKAERKRKLKANDEDAEKESRFEMDKTVTRKKKSLPIGVKFLKIQTQRAGGAVEDGRAYTHFFPHGLAEQALIQLQDSSQHQVSLWISPILGKTTLYEGLKTLEEVVHGKKE